ncbi:MAG: hypothetical protein ABIX44_03465 [Cryobacterium sp.]
MSSHARDPASPEDFRLDLTPPAPAPEGQLAWESTMTAPTDWVPYAYSDAQIKTVTSRRGFSIASLACGLVGLLFAVFGVWGATVSLAAVILALVARTAEPGAKTLWGYGLATGIAGLVIVVGWIVYITQVLLPTLG